MRAPILNSLLRSTRATFDPDGARRLRFGTPFARESALGAFTYTAVVPIRLDDAAHLVFVLSLPEAILDVLAFPDEPDDARRCTVLAEAARRIAVEGAPTTDAVGVVIDRPQIAVGVDLVLAPLRRARPRICVPVSLDVGGFVVEVGNES